MNLIFRNKRVVMKTGDITCRPRTQLFNFKKLLSHFMLLGLMICSIQLTRAANYYWVGNSGNWSDLTRWASTSNGAGSAYGTPPTAADDVFINASSFTIANQTLTINVDATFRNITFAGVLNNPFIAGVAARTIYCSGNWTGATIRFTYLGKIEFNGTGSHTINQAYNGADDFNNWVTINSSGTYTLAAPLYIITTSNLGYLRLQSGTLTTNNFAITCWGISCNVGDNVRTLNLGTSILNVYASGTALDFRGNTANFTLNSSPTCNINLIYTSTATITIEAGTYSKTIPKITNTSHSGIMQVNTGAVTTERITFGDIITSGTPGSIRIDGTSTNVTRKTFGNITASKYVLIAGANGTTWGAADRMIFTGNVTVGSFDIYGNFAEVQGDFNQNGDAPPFVVASPIAAQSAASNFRHKIHLKKSFFISAGPDIGDLPPKGTVSTEAFDTIIIDRNITINNTPGVQFGARDNYKFNVQKKATILGNIVTNANTTSSLTTTAVTNTVIIDGTIITGNGSSFTISGTTPPLTAAGIFTIDSILVGKNSNVTIIPTNTANAININELVVNTSSVLQFGTTGTATTVINRLSYTGSCNGWSVFKSTLPGTQAKIAFTNAPSITYVMIQDLNVTSANLTVTSGMNLGTNTGVTFNAPSAAQTFFWVGGTNGNNKTGTYTTGVNNNWSNPDNWALVSGQINVNNQCAPGPLDNVRFDANSFTSAGSKTCDIDQMYTYVNDFICTGATASTFLDNGIAGSPTTYAFKRILYVSGNVTMVANMANRFEGTFNFNGSGAKTITSNTQPFYGPMEFDNSAGDWTLADNLDINCQAGYGYYADFTITQGIVRANTRNVNLEGDFYVHPTAGTFVVTTGTVIFDGVNTTNQLDQTVSTNAASPFYNFTVSRTTNNTGMACWVKQNTVITINNNFLISSGFHYDAGNQITGNGTGTLTMAANTFLYLGLSASTSVTKATTFPTSFTRPNIVLDSTSIIYYGVNFTQSVSDVPNYRNLHLVGALPSVGTATTALGSASGTTLRTKTITGPTLVRKCIYIAGYINLDDGGFQISYDGIGRDSIRMDVNSRLTIGSAATATRFPLNFTKNAVFFDHPSTVVYNSGVDQIIEGLYSTQNSQVNSDKNYSHLTLTHSGAGSATKVLNDSTLIRGNLLIDPLNIMDVTATNWGIRIAGNWTDLGSLNPRNGRVTFNGGSAIYGQTAARQIISAGAGGNGMETFFRVQFANPFAPTTANGTITMASDVTVLDSAIFANGVVTANPTTKLFIFVDNAKTRAASNNSFVDGMVRKVGDDVFEFPTGDFLTVKRWAPIGISAPALTTDHFTAQYFNTNPHSLYDRTLKDSILHHVSSAEYWILDRTNGTSNITPKLFWDSPRSGGVANLSLLRITKWDGAMWKDLGNLNPTGNTTIGNLQTASVVTSFSPFTLATHRSGGFSQNPLPIELINFTAVAVDNKYTQLEWSTSTETNNDYFTVERSRNGISNFETIARVKGAGNSSKLLNYNTQDMNPLNGISYYRLKQTDFDGKFTYSKTVAVEFGNLEEAFYIFPNPTTPENGTQLHITTSENEEVLVVVYDISGKQYFSKVMITQNNGDNIFALDLNQTLAKGVYYILATTNNNIYKKKLVIQ